MLKRTTAAVFIAACMCIPVAGCSSDNGGGPSTPDQSDHKGNTDPKVDWVWVWEKETIVKRCDGTSMVYMHTGGSREASPIAVVANDKECI